VNATVLKEKYLTAVFCCFFNDVIIKCLYYVVIEKALVLDKKTGKQWEINKNCRKSTVNEKFNRKKLFLLYKICYHNL